MLHIHTVILTLICSSLVVPYAFAEEIAEVSKASWVDHLLKQLGSSDTVDNSKLIDWGVLPGPFVNPEQGLGIGIAAVGLYTPYDWAAGDHYSTVTLTSYASTSGSFGVGIENRTYLAQDRLRLLADAWFSHSPGYYWGVGKEAAETDQNKTQYDAQIIRLEPKIALQIIDNTYLTSGWSYQSVTRLDPDLGVFTNHDLKDSQLSGIVTALEYDSRDFEPNPRSGNLLSVEWTTYRPHFGSDFDFNRWTINARHYWQISTHTIIAVEGYGQAVDGDIPWYGYSEMGSAQRMRGYYEGQYRDRAQLSTQLEVRHSFNHRHGMVTWIGAGNLAPAVDALFDENWLPTVGIGYRFAFKARINVRVDLGVGKDSTGFYFHVNEAF
ncbi:BamA/TamA family outer membrane protein [Photobacterium nomapromontoriensis]|uniref:BamA/TamA family outer membrane protein n=1 Tax=Photobacterium nomapromontoriensis TaxID=2910237 RepID=UPI003D0FB950